MDTVAGAESQPRQMASRRLASSLGRSVHSSLSVNQMLFHRLGYKFLQLDTRPSGRHLGSLVQRLRKTHSRASANGVIFLVVGGHPLSCKIAKFLT
jgi:hypothetical protein